MAMTSRLAVNVLVAFALCVLAITLALSVPDISWATMLEALTSGRQAPVPWRSGCSTSTGCRSFREIIVGATYSPG
jgi:hypothetical protein